MSRWGPAAVSRYEIIQSYAQLCFYETLMPFIGPSVSGSPELLLRSLPIDLKQALRQNGKTYFPARH